MSNHTFREKAHYVLGSGQKFYSLIVLYGLIVSLFSLGIPLSVQILINNITFTALYQPLIVIGTILFGLLFFSSFFNLLNIYIIELFQRHIYVRLCALLVDKSLNFNLKNFSRTDYLSLSNRYFDIMTIQKEMASLLTGGVSLIFQMIAGFTLLSFYHPYLLILNTILILLIFFTWKLYSRRAIETSIVESASKYDFIDWSQQIFLNPFFFRNSKSYKHGLSESISLANNYIQKRKSHFRFYYRQVFMIFCIYTIISALVLVLGGFLVIKGQLTIGQLVASELVITTILTNFAKSGGYLNSFYNLSASIDKVFSLVYQDEKEPTAILGKELSSELQENETLVFKNFIPQDATMLSPWNIALDLNKNYVIEVSNTKLKETLIQHLIKVKSARSGSIEFCGSPISKKNELIINDHLAIVDTTSTLASSVRKNLSFGIKELRDTEINKALEVVDLYDAIYSFSDNLDLKLNRLGQPLWGSQALRLTIARAILRKPKMIILGESIHQILPKRRQKIFSYLKLNNIGILIVDNYPIKDLEDFNYMKLDNKGFV